MQARDALVGADLDLALHHGQRLGVDPLAHHLAADVDPAVPDHLVHARDGQRERQPAAAVALLADRADLALHPLAEGQVGRVLAAGEAGHAVLRHPLEGLQLGLGAVAFGRWQTVPGDERLGALGTGLRAEHQRLEQLHGGRAAQDADQEVEFGDGVGLLPAQQVVPPVLPAGDPDVHPGQLHVLDQFRQRLRPAGQVVVLAPGLRVEDDRGRDPADPVHRGQVEELERRHRPEPGDRADQSGAEVGRVVDAGAGVAADRARPQEGHGQAVLPGPPQHGLGRPLRLVVAREQPVDVRDRVVLAHLLDADLVEHRDRGDVVQRLGSSGHRQLRQQQRAEHIGLPQRGVAAQEVDGGRDIDDRVDVPGQLLPALLGQAQPRLPDVGREHGHPAAHLEGPRLVVAGQGLGEALLGGRVVGRAHQADHVGVARAQQVQQQVAAEEAGGAGEQDAARLGRLGLAAERQPVGQRQVGEDRRDVLVRLGGGRAVVVGRQQAGPERQGGPGRGRGGGLGPGDRQTGRGGPALRQPARPGVREQVVQADPDVQFTGHQGDQFDRVHRGEAGVEQVGLHPGGRARQEAGGLRGDVRRDLVDTACPRRSGRRRSRRGGRGRGRLPEPGQQVGRLGPAGPSPLDHLFLGTAVDTGVAAAAASRLRHC